MSASLVSRLKFVLSSRKQTSWSKILGISGNSFPSMHSEGIPDAEILRLVQKSELVDLNWLITGEGNPFTITHFSTSECLVESLNSHISDEKWNVYLCSQADPLVIVITIPCQIEFKGSWIDYTDAQIMVGMRCELLKDCNLSHVNLGEFFISNELDIYDIDCIANGMVGTHLFLSEFVHRFRAVERFPY